jgi:hypothetical protein
LGKVSVEEKREKLNNCQNVVSLHVEKKLIFSIMKKATVIEAMKELPQDFELEKLLEKLVFMEKIEIGLIQLEQGNTITHDEVIAITKQW